MQHELKEILHRLEKAHKADIQTYSSGHLGPHSFTHNPLNRKPIWKKLKCKDMGACYVQESSKLTANAGEPTDSMHSFSIRSKLEEPRIQESPASLSKEFPITELMGVHDMTELTTLRSAIQEKCAVSDVEEREKHPYILKTKDLMTRKCLSGRDAAIRHERKLQKAIRKLPDSRGPCRERLAVFSDVFDDVCDCSPAYGSILREIKTEYDLYLKSLLSCQPLLRDKSLPTSFGVSTEATELKEATEEVLLLEQEVRRALEENNRVRIDYEEVQAKSLVDPKENERCEPEGQCDEVMSPELNQCKVSIVAQVEALRQQVWNMWYEVQRLEKHIRETMVSTITTNALENCIRESEDEILNLAALSVFYQRSNKDLERNIASILSKAEVDEATSAQVWEAIWTTLNGHD